jgi:hypothetical protein
LANTYSTGASVVYAAGGVGGGPSTGSGVNGPANSGNGGGGSAGDFTSGKNGGSGIVVIRYAV